MKKDKYIGFFKNNDGDKHELVVYCNGFTQAFILLTADAINKGRFFQLESIENEEGFVQYVHPDCFMNLYY